MQQLSAPVLQVRIQAAEALLKTGSSSDAAFPELVNLLVEDQQVDAAIAARALLARPVPDQQTPHLVECLKLNTHARVAAAWQLSHLRPGPAESMIIHALMDALQHTDKHERNFILLALLLLAEPDDAILSIFEAASRDTGSPDSPYTNYKYPRTTAILALGLMGPGAAKNVPLLVEILDDKQTWDYQRAAACFAIGRMGPAAAPALSRLEQALLDNNPVVARQARLAKEAINAAIGDSTRLPDKASGQKLSSLVGELRSGNGRIDPQLLEGLRRLGAFAGSQTIMFKQKSRPVVHESIALALGYIDSLADQPDPREIALQPIKGGVRNDNWMYIMALGGVQQGIGPALLEALSITGQDPRREAIRRLADLGPLAAPAIPALREALDDPDWMIRRDARLALRRIETP